MNFSLIGFPGSRYTKEMLEYLAEQGLKPSYVILENNDPARLADTDYFISSGTMPPPPYTEQLEGQGAGRVCIKHQIPVYWVDSQNSQAVSRILFLQRVDILLLTDGPVIRGEVLSLPRYCALNIHAAPLPMFRGNWTTWLALYNDYPARVSAHAAVSQVDAGAIIATLDYDIARGDTLEDENAKAWKACKQLACSVLRNIAQNSFIVRRQWGWQGTTYKGQVQDGVLCGPAMPEGLQEELAERMAHNLYGFYAHGEKV